MSGIDMFSVKPEEFGQLAEQVFGDRGGYDERTRQAVIDRTFALGTVVGRTVVITAFRDGEVGPQVVIEPRGDTSSLQVERQLVDPIAQGV